MNLTQRFITALFLTLSISGCSWFYPENKQQGNVLDAKQIAQLKAGMTISEVKTLLGTPVLNQNRLIDEASISEKLLIDDMEDEQKDISKIEYISLRQLGNNQPVRKSVSLLFEDGKLIKFHVS